MPTVFIHFSSHITKPSEPLVFIEKDVVSWALPIEKNEPHSGAL